MHFIFEFSIGSNHLLGQSPVGICVRVTELACKNTLVFFYFVLNYLDFLDICIHFFHGNSQQVVGKAAGILPVMILLKLPKKRRIRKQKTKRQLINPNMSQHG